MAKLKTYSLGVNGFITPAIRDALGLPRHVTQASVIAVASTKAEAVRVLAERGFRVSLSDSEFRQAMGATVTALQAAGMCDEPCVLVTKFLGRAGAPVLVVDPGGVPRRVGRLESAVGYRSVFVPEEG